MKEPTKSYQPISELVSARLQYIMWMKPALVTEQVSFSSKTPIDYWTLVLALGCCRPRGPSASVTGSSCGARTLSPYNWSHSRWDVCSCRCLTLNLIPLLQLSAISTLLLATKSCMASCGIIFKSVITNKLLLWIWFYIHHPDMALIG